MSPGREMTSSSGAGTSSSSVKLGDSILSSKVSISGSENPVRERSKSSADQRLEFESEQVFVPGCILGEFVVGENVGALLRIGEMIEHDNRHSAAEKGVRAAAKRA